MHRSTLVVSGFLALGLGLGGCAQLVPTANAPTTGGTPTSSPVGTAAPPPSSAPPSTATADPNADLKAKVETMTPAQLAGQLVMVSITSTDAVTAVDSLLTTYDVGSVMLMGTWTSSTTVKQTATHLQGKATGGIGLYIAVDQEGGQVQRLKGGDFTAMPAATTQGTWTAAKLTTQAAAWGHEMAAAGVNLDLAPVADTVPASLGKANAPIGAYGRQFGSTPDVTGPAAAAFITGLKQAGVASCVKHFPGLGRVTGNTDTTTTGITDDVTTAADPYVSAFATAIAAGPGAVMVSLATYTKIDPSGPAAFSKPIVTDLLRGQLGWAGVVVSDSMDAAAVSTWTPGDRAITFVAAGGDISIWTGAADAQTALTALAAKITADAAFAGLAKTSVLRVLVAKRALGLV